jgi:SAM-dependent methyltransferase
MRGVRQIVRFNWPFYAGALSASTTALWLMAASHPARPVQVLIIVVAGLGLFWIGSSLVVSWIVYDLSALSRWLWIRDVLGFAPRRWINVHAGFDDSTGELRRMFSSRLGRVFDIFDPIEMREPSIRRARALTAGRADAERVDFHHLPAADRSVDAALFLLSAHELRSEQSRETLFREVARVLSAHGRVVVAEHLRDVANFTAFGPGFLHFHSRRTWRRCFQAAKLTIEREFHITPFVGVFVLRRAV